MIRPPLLVTVALALAMAACNTAPPGQPLVRPPTPTATQVESPEAKPVPVSVVAPPGVIAGVAVFDRQTGAHIAQLNGTRRFRSASLVKILIALDYLWNRGPDYAIPAADKTQLEVMLRGSDDNAASYFYQRIGGEPAINRMITRLSLQDTKPPSAVNLKGWGSTTLSANDVVRVYQYIVEESPAGLRQIMLSNLRQSTACGTDHYHQTFGIPAAFPRPWTVKQGWWGFGDQPANPCTAQTSPPALPTVTPTIRGAAPALMTGRVLHTCGTVGENDRYIVAVLTQYPSGTSFLDAYATITLLTHSLLPG